MKKNVGGIDRNIRIAAGIALLAAGIFAPLGVGWKTGMFAVSLVALATAFTGLCPLWSVLGINTYKEHREEAAAGPKEKIEAEQEKGAKEQGKPAGQ
ncbi:MAG: DUF2892 domain-containing protein [Nitrospirota bacterium]|nr:DUF2892 domain-containing protein [Nitrospirota bacterium]